MFTLNILTLLHNIWLHIDSARVSRFLSDSDTSVDKDEEKKFIKDFHVGCKEPFFLFLLQWEVGGKEKFHLAYSSPKCCFKRAKIEDG